MKDAILEEIDEPKVSFDVHSSVSSARLQSLRDTYFFNAQFPDLAPKKVTGLTLHRFDSTPADRDWNDANHYLYLWVNERPSAFVGWLYTDLLIPRQMSVWITAIQGVYHLSEPKPVPPKSWEKGLVQCIEDIFRGTGLDSTCITPAELNTWFEFKNGAFPLQQKQAKMRRAYNATAQELGYTLRTVQLVHFRPNCEEVVREPQFMTSVYTKPLVKI